jgi:dUTP pyrophosphatase
MTISIKFKKLVPEAKLPTKGKPGDAAYDLYCVEKVVLGHGETKQVRTGLVLADMTQEDGPDLLFLQIEGRSGIASNGVYPVGGIIDPIYRGEIQVILHNGNLNTDVSYQPGARIAQFVIRRTPKDVLIEESDAITQTVRGALGFGSTGS